MHGCKQDTYMDLNSSLAEMVCTYMLKWWWWNSGKGCESAEVRICMFPVVNLSNIELSSTYVAAMNKSNMFMFYYSSSLLRMWKLNIPHCHIHTMAWTYTFHNMLHVNAETMAQTFIRCRPHHRLSKFRCNACGTILVGQITHIPCPVQWVAIAT